jgi:hypothetical protein
MRQVNAVAAGRNNFEQVQHVTEESPVLLDYPGLDAEPWPSEWIQRRAGGRAASARRRILQALAAGIEASM